jgi:hypothetical protein
LLATEQPAVLISWNRAADAFPTRLHRYPWSHPHDLADKHGDAATTSLLENFLDATERRTWFLFEASRDPDASGH